MKLLLLISVSLLVCFSVLTTADDSTTPRKANCDVYGSDMCTRELIPVCGDDGESYSNECQLCVASREKNKDIMVAKYGKC